MTSTLPMQSEIWGFETEIWPDFAKSGICNLAEIWIFLHDFIGLIGEIQISEGVIRNLIRNLNFSFQINALRQISDFGNSPLKGWVASPARGEVHHPPLGDVPGPKFWPVFNPTTAVSYRQAPARRRLPPEQPTTKETTHG